MIYFDNAATTKYKPDEVIEALNYYLMEVGVSPGRGSYSLGIEASRMLYKSRTADWKILWYEQSGESSFHKKFNRSHKSSVLTVCLKKVIT